MTDLPFPFMTREIFDTLILVVVIIGLGLAVVRLHRDFTRPLPPRPPSQSRGQAEIRSMSDDDEQTHHPEPNQNV